ncbi:hypothetical protein HS088_TW21G00479 [Tripterygium wilfordii]|uniref:Prolamin-like domain-containing protein n=1 Tax=Tripterygium wilfordii TaxID=458696 RepID=A0A7J7C2H9_TRIWF|nr:uncharacterized protein LOC119989616 [Tripterygium wilfordii]KAF5728332.1 hypothetical protein HS088_TW21G00479 [Tripterygium wilfordii]
MARLMSIIPAMMVLIYATGSLEIAVGQRSKYEIVIANCERRIPIGPGQELYDYIFKNKESVSDEVCQVLVKAGQPCHDVLINETLKRAEFKGLEVGYLQRSDEIWNKCLSVSKCVPQN